MDEPERDNERRSYSDLLKLLRPVELRYLRVRLTTNTDKEACEQVGIPAATVYQWANRAIINEALQLAQQDGALLAFEILRRGLGKAADVLVSDLEHEDWKAAHDSAKEVLNRLGVAAAAKVDVTTNGESLNDGIRTALERRLSRLATSGEAPAVSGEPE